MRLILCYSYFYVLSTAATSVCHFMITACSKEFVHHVRRHCIQRCWYHLSQMNYTTIYVLSGDFFLHVTNSSLLDSIRSGILASINRCVLYFVLIPRVTFVWRNLRIHSVSRAFSPHLIPSPLHLAPVTPTSYPWLYHLVRPLFVFSHPKLCLMIACFPPG